MPRGLVRRGAFGVSGKLTSLGLQTLHFAILARALSTATFGSLMAALALLLILGALAELGMTNAAVLSLAEGHDEAAIVRATLRASALLITGSLFLAAFLAALLLQGDAQLAVLVLVPWFALSNVDVAFIAVHQHELRIGRIASAEVASRSVLVAAVVPLVIWGDDWSAATSLVVVGAGFLISELVSLAVVLPGVRRRGELPPGTTSALARRAIPIGLANSSSFVHARSDQVILDAMGRSTGLASYAVAARINEALLALTNAAGAVTFPVIASSTGGARSLATRRFSRVACCAGAGAGFVVFVVAPQLLVLLGGRSFRSSSDLARLLVPALAVSVANLPLAQSIIAAGRARALLWLSVSAAVLNICLTIALVSVYDERGAALATSTTEVMGFWAVAFLAARARPGSVPWPAAILLPFAVVAGCAGGLALWRADLEPLAVLAGLVAVVAVLAAAAFDPGGDDPVTEWRAPVPVGSAES